MHTETCGFPFFGWDFSWISPSDGLVGAGLLCHARQQPKCHSCLVQPVLFVPAPWPVCVPVLQVPEGLFLLPSSGPTAHHKSSSL